MFLSIFLIIIEYLFGILPSTAFSIFGTSTFDILYFIKI